MGTVERFSVFEFSGGPQELFSYLFEQGRAGNTAVFTNEGVTVAPDAPVSQRLSLAVYAGLAENPRVVEDYVRYLTFRMGKEAD